MWKIGKLAEFGNALKLPHSKALGQGLFELRTRSGVRVFSVFRTGRRVVLLDGIVKKRDDIPPATVARMRALADAVPQGWDTPEITLTVANFHGLDYAQKAFRPDACP